MKFQTQC